MRLSSTLAWLVDSAGEMPGVEPMLAELGARLLADGLPLAGGALGLADHRQGLQFLVVRAGLGLLLNRQCGAVGGQRRRRISLAQQHPPARIPGAGDRRVNRGQEPGVNAVELGKQLARTILKDQNTETT
jgi:hypothetical protein